MRGYGGDCAVCCPKNTWRRLFHKIWTIQALFQYNLRGRLATEGWDTGRSESQIVPVILGSPERTMEISSKLRDRGIWAPSIRPPSVPAGESLLRLGFTAGHTGELVERLLETLKVIGRHPGPDMRDIPI
ncbi:aminotransferase class I/II-fold pyridoxal phosphate-dependent enzyme [Bythopirellula goksoeyrii]|uniref:aminotransferase class I/II-fold pyridoxal phosphate-dependent enzyme n=1 Tax=Bythopirellula goksoeyrii TaxID=1400387 RepID=UPI00143E00DD|nr:aminotransferase class I/II-fold pyridoxal phosphate-dependent enzyme [Bythopirellula goksoeyrii]